MVNKRVVFTAKPDDGFSSEIPHYLHLFFEDIVGDVDIDKLSSIFESRRVRVTVEALTGGRESIYPCDKCGTPRTKAEGGTTFTVCDACWDKDLALTGGREK